MYTWHVNQGFSNFATLLSLKVVLSVKYHLQKSMVNKINEKKPTTLLDWETSKCNDADENFNQFPLVWSI